MFENVENIIKMRCFNMYYYDVVFLLQLLFYVLYCVFLFSILYYVGEGYVYM